MHTLRLSVGDEFHEIFVRTDRVIQHALFCLIYRGVPVESNQDTVFRKESLSNARQAIEEHQACMNIVSNMEEEFLETYINWYLTTRGTSSLKC